MAIPADDLARALSVIEVDGADAAHLGVVGDTYTVTVPGEATAGRFCVIDMHVPPGGGPPPHRHDFEETFVVLEGEVTLTFRGQRSVARQGMTVQVPANAPHQFHNTSETPARLICICAPAGQDAFFAEIGVPVEGRTTPAPKPSPEEAEVLQKKAQALAAKYKTEFLDEA